MDNLRWLVVAAVVVVVAGTAWSVRSCSGPGGEDVAEVVVETTTTLPAGEVVGNYAVSGSVEVSLLGGAVEVRPVGGQARTVVLDDAGQMSLAAAVQEVARVLADGSVGDGSDCQAGALRSLSARVDGTSVVIPPVGGVGVCARVWEALGGVQQVLATVAPGEGWA